MIFRLGINVIVKKEKKKKYIYIYRQIQGCEVNERLFGFHKTKIHVEQSEVCTR